MILVYTATEISWVFKYESYRLDTSSVLGCHTQSFASYHPLETNPAFPGMGNAGTAVRWTDAEYNLLSLGSFGFPAVNKNILMVGVCGLSCCWLFKHSLTKAL